MTDYVQQGWYGPTDLTTAAKAAIDVNPSVGGVLPASGEPPIPTDDEATDSMFAFVATEIFDVPVGLKRANPQMLSRMVGSSF